MFTEKAAAANVDTTATAALLKDKKVRVCGFGRIYNNQTYPKNLQCVDMLSVDPTQCNDDPTGFTILEGAGCLTWSNDNNICPGDYGSGVWTYDVDTKTGGAVNQKLVGIVIGSPNARRGAAPCKDGHKIIFYPWSIFATYLAGAATIPPVDV